MWWLVYIALCAGLAAISRGGNRVALLLILCGLAIVQVWKFAPIDGLIWMAFAASWVAIAGAVLRVDAAWRQRATISTLTLISAMCYPIGRFGGFAFAPGDPVYVSPLFWADMALISAILVAGGPGVVRIARNIRGAFVDRFGAGRRDRGRSGALAATEAGN